MTYNAVSVFSGIGGIDLAFSRAGFNVVTQVEIEPFCRAVLKKHAPQYWPNAEVLEDIRNVGRHNIPLNPDVIFGGFPCTDISIAGKRKGITKETRSGLWIEFARLIGEIRPRCVLLENVAAISTLGGTQVIGDLAALGYDAEWGIIPASSVGAPHRRERWFCVAYSKYDGHIAPHSRESMDRQYAGHRKGRSAPSNLRDYMHPQLWPTPNGEGDTSGGGSGKIALMAINGESRPSGASIQVKLRDLVKVQWETPRLDEWMSETILKPLTEQESWATPQARDYKGVTGSNRHSMNIPDQVKLWATPNSADSKGSHGGGQSRSLRTDTSEMTGQLSASFVEQLMGYPDNWTVLDGLPDPVNNKKSGKRREPRQKKSPTAQRASKRSATL